MLLRAVNALKALRFTAINLSKAKSERISAIRKQYDAFLEEDRKRKDRNDYIMGWLDRVRTPPTLSSHAQERSAEPLQIRLLDQPKYTQKHQMVSRITNVKYPLHENIDESTILKAVSQKYILIPKSSSKYKNENAFNPENISNKSNDLDWKRKYNILNDLKKENQDETHICKSNESIDKITTKDIVDFVSKDENTSQNKTSRLQLNDASSRRNVCRENLNENEPNFQYKLSETKNNFCENSKACDKDNIGINYAEIEIKQIQDSSEKNNIRQEVNIQEYPLQIQNKNNKINFNVENQEQPNFITTKESEDDSGISLKTIEKNHEIIKNGLESVQFIAEPHCNKLISDNKSEMFTVFSNVVVTNDVTATQNLTSFVDASDTNNDIQFNNLSAPQQTENNKDIYHESYNTNKPDLKKFENDSDPAIDGTGPETIDNTMDDQSQIEEFETEQKELFYSEGRSLNHTYDEEPTISNDNYENNEQYSYYEATKEDINNYATDLNEHEESTEQYDPRYQQQYGETNGETQLHTQFPSEEYSQNIGEGWQQQQYYDNYEQHQKDDTVGIEEQHYDNSAYEGPQENTDNLYVQNYAHEITPEKETLESFVENQLNVEDGYAIASEEGDVSNNEQSSASENILAKTNLIKS